MTDSLANLSIPGRAEFHVRMWLKTNIGPSKYKREYKAQDVFVIWFSKTLQNWKACVGTNMSDGLYFEVTHNGDKEETYVDIYKKLGQVCIPDKS
jgi:hypothetical protein